MNRRSLLKKNMPLLLLALPGIVFIFIFRYLPMFGVILAFKKYNYADGILWSPWNGLKNFAFLFATDTAFLITRNTILYNIAFLFLDVLLPVTIAIILNEIRSRKLAKFYQTVSILPHFLSWVVVSFCFFAYLSTDMGYLNATLERLGLEPVMWYTEVKYWPFILILGHIWKEAGFASVIYYTTITGISDEYYEAAIIDGASKLQQIKSITIPFMKPMIIILTILGVGRIFNSDFGLFYQIPQNSGLLYPATNVIDVYIYNGLKNMGDVGMSAAASLYQSFVGFVLVVLSNQVVKKIEQEYALF